MFNCPEKGESYVLTQEKDFIVFADKNKLKSFKKVKAEEIEGSRNHVKLVLPPGTRIMVRNFEYKLSNSHRVQDYFIKIRIVHPEFQGFQYKTRDYLETCVGIETWKYLLGKACVQNHLNEAKVPQWV